MDTEGYKKIDEAAQKTKNAVETKSWKTATMLWSNAEGVINEVTDNIDFYNILTKMEASGMRSLVARIRSKPFLRGKTIFCIIHCTVEFLIFCYSNISRIRHVQRSLVEQAYERTREGSFATSGQSWRPIRFGIREVARGFHETCGQYRYYPK